MQSTLLYQFDGINSVYSVFLKLQVSVGGRQTYLPCQQDEEGQAKCYNKNGEDDDDLYEGLQDLEKHHHVYPEDVKPNTSYHDSYFVIYMSTRYLPTSL